MEDLIELRDTGSLEDTEHGLSKVGGKISASSSRRALENLVGRLDQTDSLINFFASKLAKIEDHDLLAKEFKGLFGTVLNAL